MDKNTLLILLDTLGIQYEIFEHKAAMTVEDSSQFRGDIPGFLCKCLFLKNNAQYWLLAVPADMRVNLKLLQQRLGCSRLSFGSADELKDLLGVSPGAVTLFAAVNDIQNKVAVVLEASLAEIDRLCFHPLVNTATVILSPQGLCAFFDHTGHKPIFVQGISE